MKIGSHVSMNGNKMLLGSVEEAVSYGANTFMVYTGAPQNTFRKPLDQLRIDEAVKEMDIHGVSEIVVHAPYIINMGNSIKPATFELGINFLRQEIDRTAAMKKAGNIVLHPGAHVGAGVDMGIKQIIKGLNEVITKDQKVNIALETMAGKGSECGKSFDEIAKIIDGVKYNEKLSVCLDTCHINDSGYDIVNDFDGVLNEFDKIIGIDRLKVIHLNDSKNPRGSRKDRHEMIGFGSIGFDVLCYIANHKDLKNIPKILETPYLSNDKGIKKPPYKYEIDMLKSGTFNGNIKQDIFKN
ncbi:MAG: deoxyribonuclease IV [Clostridium sp.]|uniref:deoxyribonuclease IV n=1 Tax=Clostridium sp. TaxID=1506 RepID=UPI0025C202F7|nr:deoxyribonuclease IV [Clostridium sp.]MCH3963635.1 deoxyribonuclease IV [Clostridium sp.]MCI1714776.1 deoxyribonuclease IV [Clostridium sp.]MCI1799035.1 deoxyribonuclease IV [Clostridium sp.]MCI1812959.1 deoxyribonuclease IV [Clostridium sp.]MCI1869849.1 deoxyribonuclease IV [Clostridium sp.]